MQHFGLAHPLLEGSAKAGINGHNYTCSKSWIEFKAPSTQGVYCIHDEEDKALFTGKGKVG